MVQLLKIRASIFQFVARFETYLQAAVKFVIAYAVFNLINTTFPYTDQVKEYPVALILALLCCFLPSGLMLFCSAGLILLQFYGLSKELCAVVAIVFVLLFCVYFRFSSRKGIYAILTGFFGHFGIPYIMPVAAGLVSQPYTGFSVGCGAVVYFILKNVKENVALFDTTEEISSKSIITMVAKQILNDKEMYLYVGAFIVTAIVVYCVRKLPADYIRHIAIVVGVAVQIVMICCGEIYLGNDSKLAAIIIGNLIALVVLLIINFMTMSLDYSRVERLQFEDDEYYYYVKAVPKSVVAKEEKKVQTINEKRTTPERGKKNRKIKKGKNVRSARVENRS